MNREQLYLQSIEDEARTGIKILALLAFCLFPVFSILDYFTQRDRFEILSLIRFSSTLFFLTVHLMFRKGHWLSRPIVTSNIILAMASFSITLMCMVLQGSASPYYAGVNLVVLAGVLILPIDGKSMAKTVSMIIGIYIAGILSVEGVTLKNLGAFVNNLFFLVSTGVIGIVSAHIKFTLRKDAFFKNLEKTEAQTAVATRDGFISMASHEMRSPLTSMKLQMDLAMIKLKNEKIDGDQVMKHVSTAYRQINNILRLVDEMLDVSRIQSGKFNIEKSPLELNDLVSGILLRYYSEQLAAGSIIHIPSHATLNGQWDSFKIEQVVVNLINNAFRYGGDSEVRVEMGKEDDFAWLAVADKGPGIAPEDQLRIFGKFEKGVSSKSGGLGLGLFISKEIVESHGGKIVLESESGKGTCFKVLLPLNIQILRK